MYSKQDQVKLWIFDQNTISGDLGVTPIIQTLASMIISSTLVHTDLHNSKIRPLAFCYPHVENLPDPRSLFGKSGSQSDAMRGIGHAHARGDSHSHAHAPGSDDAVTVAGSHPATRRPSSEMDEKARSPVHPTSEKNGLAYYYWMLVRFIFEGTEQNMLAARPGFRAWLGRLIWTAAQGAAIGIVFGFPIWCLFIVILGPLYGNGNLGGTWAPQIIKGVYGAVVGWVTNPVIAILALGSQAEQSLVVIEADEEAEVGTGSHEEGREELADHQGGTDLEGSETIHEGEIFQPPMAPGSIRRPSANSLRLADPSRSPTKSFHALPRPGTPSRPGRSRADSETSSFRAPSFHSRPPLTANTSYLSPLPSPSDVFTQSGTGRVRARSNAQATTLAPPLDAASGSVSGSARQRGATVSHPSGTVTSPALSPPMTAGPGTPRIPMTPRSFSYALGGTGGRAQRSRSGSVISQVPSMLPPQLGAGDVDRDQQGVPRTPGGRDRVWDIFGRKEGVPGAGADKVKEG